MAHTLNEIKRSYATTTEANLCGAIEELTGWEYDSTTHRMYLGNTNKFYLLVEYNNDYNQYELTLYFISDTAAEDQVIGSAQYGFSTYNGFSVWLHKSTNEKVTYFGLADDKDYYSMPDSKFEFIMAENANGEETLYELYGSSYLYIGNKHLSSYATQNMDTCWLNPSLHYGVAKIPDIFGGAEYPELYMVLNSKTGRIPNNLIRFDNGQIMRFVNLSGAGGFAFPVSDET